MIRVFLDANVYFAGCFSKSGASALVLEMAKRGKLLVVASELVLREADRNLRKKAGSKIADVFHRYLKETKIHVIPPVDDKVIGRYEPYIHPKDAPILAAAVEAQVDFLITLDRRHFMTPKAFSCSRNVKILTPGNFILGQIRSGAEVWPKEKWQRKKNF